MIFMALALIIVFVIVLRKVGGDGAVDDVVKLSELLSTVVKLVIPMAFFGVIIFVGVLAVWLLHMNPYWIFVVLFIAILMYAISLWGNKGVGPTHVSRSTSQHHQYTDARRFGKD